MDSGCEVGDNTKMWAECQKLWGSSNSPISPLFAAKTFLKVQRSAKLPPSLGRSTVGDSAALSMVVLVLIGVLLIAFGDMMFVLTYDFLPGSHFYLGSSEWGAGRAWRTVGG